MVKLKLGDLRLDMSLGTNAIIQMLARVATGKTKTGEGLIQKQDRIGAVWNWIKYKKQSPVISDIQILGEVLDRTITGDPIKKCRWARIVLCRNCNASSSPYIYSEYS